MGRSPATGPGKERTLDPQIDLPDLGTDRYVEAAKQMARVAHGLQKDKAGEPYYGHVARVALAVTGLTTNPDVIAAAYLHDIVEDTDTTLEDLRYVGFSELTITIVDALTRREGETHEEAVRRAAAHPDARLVKLCDVRDNANPERLNRLPDPPRERLTAKYRRALEILEGE